jgi:hypothetical protein
MKYTVCLWCKHLVLINEVRKDPVIMNEKGEFVVGKLTGRCYHGSCFIKMLNLEDE